MGFLNDLKPSTADSQWDLLYKIAAKNATAPSSAPITPAVKASSVVAGAVRLYDVTGYNNKATDQYIQVFDSATLPADGTVPLHILLAPANFQFSLSFASGRLFSNGIAVCNSSTAVTKTIGAADCIIDINYAA